MQVVVPVRKSKEYNMSIKIKKFFKSENLNINEELYLSAKTCTCNACVGFKASFIKECSKDKLKFLNSI